MEPDGEAGGRDPPQQGVRFSSFTLGLTTRNAAGRDGDLTGLIRPKISGQYGALRLGPGRSPRTVLSTIRVGVSTRGPNHLAPVAQAAEAAGPNPACARSSRVGGTSPVMLGWLSARFVRGSARVRHSPPALHSSADTTDVLGWNASCANSSCGCSWQASGSNGGLNDVGRSYCPTGALFSCHCVFRDWKRTRCRTR